MTKKFAIVDELVGEYIYGRIFRILNNKARVGSTLERPHYSCIVGIRSIPRSEVLRQRFFAPVLGHSSPWMAFLALEIYIF